MLIPVCRSKFHMMIMFPHVPSDIEQSTWDAINLPENTKKTLQSRNCNINFLKVKTLSCKLVIFPQQIFIPGQDVRKKQKSTLHNVFPSLWSSSSGADLACRVRDGWKKVPYNFYCEKVAWKSGLKTSFTPILYTERMLLLFPWLKPLIFPPKNFVLGILEQSEHKK